MPYVLDPPGCVQRDEVDLTVSVRFVELAAAPPPVESGGMTDDEADEAEFAEE